MNNNTIQIKIKQRLNKLDSQDYDNVSCWQIAEAFNKAQNQVVRSQILGNNQRTIGDGGNLTVINDLQVLIKEESIPTIAKDLYYESENALPEDYFFYKRISTKAKTSCCLKKITVYLDEVSDVDTLLSDDNKKPSYDWGETFATLGGNKLRIYTNNEFSIEDTVLVYYRKPREVRIKNCVDLDGNTIANDQECEFNDDFAELIIDEAVSILAGDLEMFNQHQINKTSKVTNN